MIKVQRQPGKYAYTVQGKQGINMANSIPNILCFANDHASTQDRTTKYY